MTHRPGRTSSHQGRQENFGARKNRSHSHLIGRAEFEKIVVIHIPLLNQLGQSLAFRRRPSHGGRTNRAGGLPNVSLHHTNIHRITSHNPRKLLHKDPESKARQGTTCCLNYIPCTFGLRSCCVCVCVSAASSDSRATVRMRKGELICKLQVLAPSVGSRD